MSHKTQLNDSVSLWVDDQGFVFFEIDDDEDDLFECGDIGLGYLIDAVNEAIAGKGDGATNIAIENHPNIFVSRFDDEIEIVSENVDDEWTVGGNKDELLAALRSFVAES